MGRETKFGLLVGLVFIVLFGVILSGRASLSATDHAVMPTGESMAHAARAQTMHGTVDPFVADTPLDMSGGTPGPVETPEEALPGPAGTVVETTPAPRTDDAVTVGYGPVTIETPAGRSGVRGPALLPISAGGPGTVAPPVDPSRSVYVVKPGDTLSEIAHQFYGKEWPKFQQGLLDANKSTLKDPKKLLVGMKLVIPNVPAAAARPAAAPADAPRPAAPAPAAPAAPVDPSILDYNDTSLADGHAAPRTVEDVRRALREMTAPADGGRAPTRVLPVADVGPAVPVKTYAIQAGDTFNKIAAKLYGDGNKYGKLLAAKNPGVDPSRMKIGQRIVLLDNATASAPAASAVEAVVALR